ncbi:hypothetical protein [Enterococcus faecium]|uniref:hypothetical protein n=1 Tax=Enterococcus faecium TaxID=1352 RepID=UPI0030C7F910
MQGFLRHLLAFTIGGAFLAGMIFLSGKGTPNGETLMGVWNKWGIILGIDFLISLSFIVFPASRKKDIDSEAK